MPEAKTTAFISPKEVADFYGVCTKTVQRWIKEKKITTVQPNGPRGRRFIQEKDLPK